MRSILHVDMDAFFASVEQLDDPAIRGKPVLVGGRSRRGVVAAASYEARPSGVRSAMPMAEALRRCPHAIVVPPRRRRYEEVSRQVFAVFRRYTPLVEGLSVDEAFLDVTASRSLFGDGEAIARRIKDSIRAETGLTASAGVAPCKFVAKVASDLRKPDGLVVVPETEVTSFLAPLPIERMWGVGVTTAPRLHERGFHTMGDLARADVRHLEAVLGSWGAAVRQLAAGVDDRPVVPDHEAVSMGTEETYEEDLTDRASIERCLLSHCGDVAQRLCRENLCARIVVVKLKYADFTLLTRRVTLREPVADTDSVHRAALSLLDRFPGVGGEEVSRNRAARERSEPRVGWDPSEFTSEGRGVARLPDIQCSRGGHSWTPLERPAFRVRLVGVAVAGMEHGPPPRALFPDETAERRRKLESVVSAARDRFGHHELTRATLLVGPTKDRV